MSLTNKIMKSKGLRSALAGIMLTGGAYLAQEAVLNRNAYAMDSKEETKQVEVSDNYTLEQKFNKAMSQPVDETIKGMEMVDDSTYQKKVFGSDKPVIVMFYNNEGDYSKGLATLTESLNEEFGDKIKFLAYKASENEKTEDNKLRSMISKYDIKEVPSLYFFDNDNGSIKREERLNGGIKSTDFYKKIAPEITNFINKNLLD